MFRMHAWQWAVVMAVAAACVGYMGWTIVRMFGQPAQAPAELREATGFESMLLDVPPPGTRVFDGWSYRVPARLAGRVRVVIDRESISIAGPRVPGGAYRAWIWAQDILLALVPAALAWTLVGLDWRPLLVAVGLFVASAAVSTLGAAGWPSFGELELLDDGRFTAVEFPRDAPRDVSVGEGWARGGLEVVLLPYKAGVDAMAKGRAVSFFGPDGEGREARYAIHLYSDEQAEELARILREGAP